ncbi:hypothetical protein GALMADRAFT_249423 [Galerina marginata CBS 339.88]|uniref:MARVEL domain-containing protein n=1 Tax=Galerina marginata (strain CBS 339.88) TaxID=685588 RepID=A0A067T630_GALM3|nr:hypothetical protein GALMADRAFT_249423 [Galerina marginata CBS 339.88]
MTRVTTRTFCCCIPVRAGAILLAILGLIGGSGVAAIGIINLKHNEGSRTTAVLQIIIYLLLAIVSIFGLIGAITKRLAFIRVYLAMLIFHLLFSMGTGIYAIHRSFKDAPKYISDCMSGSTDKGVISVCNNGAALLKSVVIGSFILAWLLETWACVIVAHYSKQLAEEEATKSIVKDTESW